MHDAFTLHVNSTLHGLSSLHNHAAIPTPPRIERAIFMTCARIMLLHMATCWSNCLKWSSQSSSLTQHTNLQSQHGLQGNRNMQIKCQPLERLNHARKAHTRLQVKHNHFAKPKCHAHMHQTFLFCVVTGSTSRRCTQTRMFHI